MPDLGFMGYREDLIGNIDLKAPDIGDLLLPVNSSLAQLENDYVLVEFFS